MNERRKRAGGAACRQVDRRWTGQLVAALLALFPLTDIAAPISAEDSNTIFSYAEEAYPQFLSPAGAVSQTVGAYYYRYYSGSNAYIATATIDGSDRFLYLGPASDNQIVDLGAAADWLALGRNGLVLETKSQTISAAQGGTITLAGGSSVTIPAGVLASDQSVTLALKARLLNQPPGGLIRGTGPVLALSFGSTTPFAQTAGTQGLQFNLRYGATLPARLTGSIPIVDIVDADNFAALVPLSCDSGSTCTVVPLNLIQQLPVTNSIQVGAGNTATDLVPLPQLGNQSWDGTSWQPGVYAIDPSKKYLILVHGMLSSAENAFGERDTVENIRLAGGYDKVLGFNYDWSKGVDENGAALSSFLTSLKSAGLNSVDIEAHSEGGAVSLSALCRNSDINIGNLVMLGSPVMGTPAADLGTVGQAAGSMTLLGSVLLNLPSKYLPPDGQTAQQLLGGQFAPDLSPSSSVLSYNNGCVAGKMNQSGSTLSGTKIACVGGTVSESNLSWLGSYIGTSSDGVVPTSSAMCEGAGFNSARLSTKSFPLSHTRLTSDADVASWVGTVVKATAPTTTIYKGQFNGQGTFYRPFPGYTTCAFSNVFTGTITVTVTTLASGSSSSSVDVAGDWVSTAVGGSTADFTCLDSSLSWSNTLQASGSLPSIGWTDTFSTPGGSTVTGQFTGTLSGNAINGTLVETIDTSTGSATIPVTLSKQ